MQPTTKPWYESRTLWFNAITIIVGIVGQVTKTINVTGEAGVIFAGILSIGNFILRFLTTTAISTTPTT